MCNNNYPNDGGNESMQDTMTDQYAPTTTSNNDLWRVSNYSAGIRSETGFTQNALNSSIFPSDSHASYRTTVMECYAIVKSHSVTTGGAVSVRLAFPNDAAGDINGANRVNGTINEGVSTFNVENGCSYPVGSTYYGDSRFCNATTESTKSITSANDLKNVTFNITNACEVVVANAFENITLAWTAAAGVDVNLVAMDWANANRQAVCINMTYKIIDAPIVIDTSTSSFTITGLDDYDGISLLNLSVRVVNSSDIFNFTTANGTILIENTTGPIKSFNVTYNITFFTNQSGGYFNVTEVINLTNGGSRQIRLPQSLLSLNITDLITGTGLTSFTVGTNRSIHAGTNGYILLPSRLGFHAFNISSTQYPVKQFTYSIGIRQNLSFVANMSPRFEFSLRKEADNSVFDVKGTNTTKLTIFCPNKNIIINFKNNSAESRNSTQENATIDCAYTLMKMDITYPDSSYFRTLIPETTQQNVTWWLLDLNIDTGVQVILQLVDLTGDFTSGLIRIKKAIDQNNEDMIEQGFDIETSVVLYLLKDGFYTVSIENNDGTIERQLGTLIADTAGTKTITFPSIPFYPDKVLYDNISWAYTFNISSSILRLQYEDKTTNTTLIRWRIFNGTNTTDPKLLQTFETTNPGASVTYTFNNAKGNETYLTDLFIQNKLLPDFNISEQRVFGNFEESLDDFEGFTEEAATNIKLYASSILLVVWGMLFTAKHAGVGLTSTFFWVIILRWMGWFPIPIIWVGLMGLIVFFGWVVESMKK